jgi:thimet oligopeptidase
MEKFLNLNLKDSKSLLKETDAALKTANEELAAIMRLSSGAKHSVSNTLEPLNRITAVVSGIRSRASFFAAVHPNPKIRSAAERATKKISRFSSGLYLRRDLYEAVKSVSEVGLDEGTRRFRRKELLDFELTGVGKDPGVRREIKSLMNRAVKLGQAFDRNIKDDVRYLKLSPADLEGLPEDYRKSHKPNKSGVVRISTQYPDYYPFMEYATSGKARRALSFLSKNRGWPKNDKVFRELLATRKRQAELAGYTDWADYITADKMTGSAKMVHRFIDRVAVIAKKPSRRDYKTLLARKQKDYPRARSLDTWDLYYYENLVTKERIGLDTQEVREYLPFGLVKRGILRTGERFFGVSYRRVLPPTWHRDVEAFDVYHGRALIGRFYFDLHPRKGKYGHAACFDIRSGIRGVQLPEASLVCNFSKGLMSHNEVTTFFHEFGHLMHCILAGDQVWIRFNGFGAEWDFVEAPSQMFEAWALDYGTLKRFARHHRFGKTIPKALVEKMRQANKFGRGVWMQGQNFYSALSLRYHQDKDPRRANLVKIMQTTQKKYDIQQYPPGMHFYASFGHLNGYSAIYYTYQWSRAIAEDILSLFKRKGIYDRKTTMRYVREILVPGGSKDASQLVHNFLKRNWKLTAFRKWLEE